MNLKKLGIVALTTATLLTPFAPIMADDKSGTTQVTYEEQATYDWTIPSGGSTGQAIALDNGEQTSTLAVSGVHIASGYMIKITAKGSGTDGAFTMANGSSTMAYTVKVGDGAAISPGATVLTCPSTDSSASVTLKFAVAKESGKVYEVGSYSGTVTYTATIVKNS